jgi:hypothetical protein
VQVARLRFLAGIIVAAMVLAAGFAANASAAFVQQGEKLTGGAEEPNGGGFGSDVALSGDGSTALIAADNADATWAFTRAGGSWSKQGGPIQGRVADVALSADGNTALLATPFSGVSVFTRSGETWTQQGGQLPGGTGELGGNGGPMVALSADGNTALIGGPEENKDTGKVWVFTRSGETWTQQAEFVGDEASGFGFGFSVALSANGNTALIGGPMTSCGEHCERYPGPGAAWIFVRSGSTWTQQGNKLTVPDSRSFGQSVALSADGNTALIDSPLAVSAEGWQTGSAWEFTRSGETWTPGAKITATGEIGPPCGFANSVALSADGNTALFGGPEDSRGTGAVWVFARSGETWTQSQKLKGAGIVGGSEFGGGFGRSVAFSSATNTALIGEPNGNAVWVFVNSPEPPPTGEPPPPGPPPTITSISPKNGRAGSRVRIKGTNLSNVQAVGFGSAGVQCTTEESSTSITVVAPPPPATASATAKKKKKVAVNVTVRTRGGTSAISTATRFKYR